MQVRPRLYEGLLADPDLIEGHRYPHSVALLHEVRRLGYPTGLATVSHREHAQRVLGILGLRGELDVVATRDHVERSKPDPEIDLLLARELGMAPEGCLVVEDSPAGVAAGLAAGMEVVAVATELTRRKFRDTDLLDRCRVVDGPRAAGRVAAPDLGPRRCAEGTDVPIRA